MEEEWRSIPGFERYEASSMGRIRKVSEPLKQTAGPGGYAKVTLYDGDKAMKTVPVHRAVCAAFHGRDAGQVVRHLNGVNTDNTAGNLAWGTHKQNAVDRARHFIEKIESGAELGDSRNHNVVRKLMHEQLVSISNGVRVLREMRNRK